MLASHLLLSITTAKWIYVNTREFRWISHKAQNLVVIHMFFRHLFDRRFDEGGQEIMYGGQKPPQ